MVIYFSIKWGLMIIVIVLYFIPQIMLFHWPAGEQKPLLWGQLSFFFYGLHLKCSAEPSCFTNVFPEASHSSKNSTILNWCFPRRVCLSEKEDPIVLSWKSWSNLLIQLDARGLRRTRRLEKVMGWLSVADTHCEPLNRDKVSSFSWHMQAPN